MYSIKDVAEKSGVSIATISRHFRGTAKVSAETAEKIKRATQELNYIPDFFASTLKSSYSNILCFMVSDIKNFFFNSIVEYLEKALQVYNYNLMFALTYQNGDILKKNIQTFLSMRSSAFLYVPDSSMAKDYDLIKNSEAYPLQLFLDIDPDIDSVTVDDAYGTEIAVEYFFEKGYTDVVMIDFGNINFYKNRLRGYINAYEKHKLVPSNENLCIVNESNLENTIKDILDNHKHPAILAVANYVGIAVIRQIYARRLKLKEDVSLIIYDDMEIAEIMNIDCVSHNKQEITNGIIETLFEGIKQQKNKSERILQKKVFKPFLLKRDSV